MSLPILPLDIIAEVVSHLEEELTDVDQLVSEGKTVSLVCKEWKPLGQALRWRRMDISTSQVPSLLTHFALHTHLPKLVRSLKVQEAKESTGNSSSRLPGLLTTLVNLRQSTVLVKPDHKLSPIFKALSHLEHLSICNFGLRGNIEWSGDFSSIFLGGFRKLSNLVILFDVLEFPDVARNFDKGLRFRLEELTIAWSLADNAKVVENIFSIIDPTTLHNVDLTYSAACVESIRWLSRCPNLLVLSISNVLEAIANNFRHILSFLPQFPSLKHILVKVMNIPKGQPISSPVSLTAILASFPPSLKSFDAAQFVFVDFEAIPTRKLIMPPQEDYKFLLAMFPSFNSSGEGGGRGREAIGMVVWGEALKGGTRWSCHLVDDEEEEEEGDEYEDHDGEDEEMYLEDDENEKPE
jgi:hypothetical protein